MKFAKFKKMIKRPSSRIIKNAAGMNKTEAAYAQFLSLQKHAGEILDWRFEWITLTLAKKTKEVRELTYRPDFFVISHDVIAIHETKGFKRPVGMAKLKIAAELYPWFEFWLVEKDGSGWRFTNYSK